MMRAKIGLLTEEAEDGALVQELLETMHIRELDYTNTFVQLSESIDGRDFSEPLRIWGAKWRDRLARQSESAEAVKSVMRKTNPQVIPRNERVEEALEAAEVDGDLQPFNNLLAVVSSPGKRPQDQRYIEPPEPGSPKCVTFCGT